MELSGDLVNASICGRALESFGNKADSFHKHIKEWEDVDLLREFEKVVRECLKKLKLGRVVLAIDTTKIEYYGKNKIDTRSVKEGGKVKQVWEFVQIAVVSPFYMPLMSVRYSSLDDLKSIVRDLIRYAKTLPFKIDCVLFDRGFYAWETIDFLNSKEGVPYLIFTPRNEKIQQFIDETKNSFQVFQHEGQYSRKKTTLKPETKIVVCKNAGQKKNGDPYHMAFATNLKPSLYLMKKYAEMWHPETEEIKKSFYLILYRIRWCIETGFREIKKCRIQTNSNEPIIRLLYFILQSLLILLWTMRNIFRRQPYAKPLKLIEYLQTLNTTKQILKPPPI